MALGVRLADKKMTICTVGDGDVGKTTLIKSFTKDTTGKRIYHKIVARQRLYIEDAGSKIPEADVYLLCFSVDNRSSLDNAVTTWLPSVKEKFIDKPKVLVACKTDLRKSTPNFITKERGIKIAEENGLHYAEACSENKEEVESVFLEAVQIAKEFKGKNTKVSSWFKEKTKQFTGNPGTGSK